MTWQQSRLSRYWETTAVVLGKRTDWRNGFSGRHLQPTACHFNAAEAEVRVNVLPWARIRQVFMCLRRSCSQSRANTWSHYWFGPGFSCCACLLALDWRFCAEETPAVSWLLADRPNSWTHGWMAAHPIKTPVDHACSGKVLSLCVCVCLCTWVLLPTVSLWCVCVCLTQFWWVCADVDMFVCAQFISIDCSVMRVKSVQPREVWINRRSQQTNSSTAIDNPSQTAGPSILQFQYMQSYFFVPRIHWTIDF